MDLSQVADELYGVPPEEFTRLRNERARRVGSDGDRDLAGRIRGLRKPSTSAWALNMLQRQYPEEIDRLLALGIQLREAQASLAGNELRELTRQRRHLVTALARRAGAVALDLGHPISRQVESELEQTLNAALVDPAAADALRSGRLTTTVSYAGMGPTYAGMAPPPAPASGTAPTSRTAPTAGTADSRRRRELDEATRATREATDAAAGATEALRRAEHRVAEVTAHLDAVRERIDALQAELRQAQAQLTQLVRDLRTARLGREAASRADQLARRSAEHARDRLARVDSEPEPDG